MKDFEMTSLNLNTPQEGDDGEDTLADLEQSLKDIVSR
jgi:hypothetical protein